MKTQLQATPETLEKLILGQLPVEEADRLAEACEHESRLTALAEAVEKRSDTMLDSLRNHRTVTDTETEDLVERMVSRLKNGTLVQELQPPSAEPLSGETPSPHPEWFEQFRIQRVLGEGGMGTVYLAEDTRLDRLVAIKTLKSELAAHPTARDRFFREARSAAKIQHDHIIPIYYVGEYEGTPFLAMPFLQGEPLNDRLQHAKSEGKRLPPEEIMRIGFQIALGLSAAHESGLIHRDIKPGNIWLEAGSGRAKILDFGLARSFDERSDLTRSGMIVGTPAYMAPEQARGEPVDPRGDLFSLGCVMYEMATGRRPFKGESTMAVLTALAVDHPPAPISLNPNLPPALSDFILKLLEKRAEDRPDTASGVAEELKRMLREQKTAGVSSSRSTPTVEVNPWAEIDEPTELDASNSSSRSGHRRGSFLFVALGILILIGCGFGLYELVFKTPDGTLIVEVADTEVEARFKNGVLQLYDAQGEPRYTLKPSEKNRTLPEGSYQIEVTGIDGLKLDTDKFEMRKGDTITVRVTFAPPKVVPKKSPPNAEPDRLAAEYILSVGGTVQVNELGASLKLKAELPKEPFRLLVIDLAQNRLVTDAGLEACRDCKHLISFAAYNSTITDAGLAHFKNCKNLRYMGLNVTPITDAGLAHFKDCTNLIQLTVGGCTNITDAGLAHLKQCRWEKLNLGGCTKVTDAGLKSLQHLENLWSLDLFATQVTDAGLAHLKDSKNLTELSLGEMPITPAGLANLKDCKKLSMLCLNGLSDFEAGLAHFRESVQLSDLHLIRTNVSDANLSALKHWKQLKNLRLQKTAVTRAGLDDLRIALPGCRIEWDGGTIESSDSPDQRGAEYVISIGGWVNVNDVMQPIRNVADLPKTPYRLTWINLAGNPKVTDDGLATCRGCKHLHTLDVFQTAVTDAGLAHFKDNANIVQFAVNRTAVTDAGLAHFKGYKSLGLLYLGDAPRVTDAGLANFKDCRNLGHLDLHGTQVTDAGLAQFKGFENLWYLDLFNTRVTDAGMVYFKNAKNLGELGLNHVGVTDAGLSNFDGCTNLKALHLLGSRATDAGLVRFKDCKNLTRLWLGGSQITDAGLTLFKDCKQLTEIKLERTGITRAGIDEMRRALPQCKIDWDGDRNDPNALTEAMRVASTSGDSPSRDLFAGEMLVRETFDDPTNCPTFLGTRDGIQCKAEKGQYIADVTGAGKIAEVWPQLGGPDLGFVVRSRREGGTLFVNFRHRVSSMRWSWLCLDVDPLGNWKLYRTEMDKVEGGWDAKRRFYVVAESTKAEPELVTGKWMTVVGRTVGPDCELWANGQLLLRVKVADGGDDGPPIDPKGIEFGLRSVAEKAKFEVDHYAIWDLDASPDRKAAEYVLANGGSVRVTDSDRERDVRSFHDLPRKLFRLLDINLNANPRVTDEGLACFQGCTSLRSLSMYQTKVTDAGLAYFKNCKELTHINLYETKVGDEGMLHLKDCKKLSILVLASTKVSNKGLAAFQNCRELTWLDLNNNFDLGDEGLSHFKDCKKLTLLHLWGLRLTDEGAAHFKGLSELTNLRLGYTQISDDGLAVFKDCKQLQQLVLSGTTVGDAGANHFKDCPSLLSVELLKTNVTNAVIDAWKKSLPHSRFEWDGGLFEPTGWADRRAAVYLLSIGGQIGIVTDGKDSRPATISELPREAFRLTTVNLDKNTKVNDHGLSHFKGCKNLTTLSLLDTRVTDEGLVYFKDCKRLQSLNLTDTDISDHGLAHFKDCNELAFLSLSGAKIGDAGLIHFKGCTELKSLDLRGTRVSDAGLAYFRERKQLTTLNLQNTAVNDTGLAHLHGCKNLTLVLLERSRATLAGIDALRKASPLCKIGWNGGTLEPLLATPNPEFLTLLNPPDARAFPGAVVFRDHFSDPKRTTLLQSKEGGAEHLVRAGAYTMRYADAKPGQSFIQNIGPAATDMAFATRLTATNVTTTIAFRIRGTDRRSNWLEVRISPDGIWSLYRCNATFKDGSWVREIDPIQEATAADPALASGQGIAVAGRAIGNWYEVWINGKLVRRGNDDPKFAEPSTFPDAIQIVGVAKVAGPASLSVDYAVVWDLGEMPDRKAAEYVLSLGGYVSVNHEDRQIKTVAELPKEPFALTLVMGLTENPKVSDAGLSVFRGCKHLSVLSLGSTPVTDVCLAHFGDCKRLTQLDLSNTRTGDAGLAHFAGGKSLHYLNLFGTKATDAGLAHFKDYDKRNQWLLNLHGTQVTDAGLAHFQGCKSLRYLTLSGTRVSDASLVQFKDCANLVELQLDSAPVTDVGVANFKNCKKLTRLTLSKTKATLAGVEEMKKALPMCKIEWDGVLDPK